MRKYFTLIVFALLLLSCSKEESIGKEENNFIESQILDFYSLEEMEKKINKINALKEESESYIQKKIFLTNDVSESISDNRSKKAVETGSINYNDIKDDLEFYHNEKLSHIYKLRRELGFTSLQSIADEINSLKLLNPEKSEELYHSYSNLLEKSKFQISSIYGDEISNVLNKDGKVKLGSKLLDLDTNNSEYSNNLYNEPEIETNGGGSFSYMTNDSGILGSKWGVFLVEWKAGKMRDTQNLFYRYAYYTKFAGFVNIGNHVYVSYPITLNVGSPSYCKFIKSPSDGTEVTVNFAKIGTTDTNGSFNYYSSSRSYYLKKVYIQSSSFSILVDGETHFISTSYFSRDYDNYDPNEPPLYD